MLAAHQHVFNEASFSGAVQPRRHVDADASHVYDLIALHHALAASQDAASAASVVHEVVCYRVAIPIARWR